MARVKVGELGSTITGKTPSTKNAHFFDGDIMFVTPVDLKQNYYIEKSDRHITKLGLDAIKKNSISGISVLVGCIGSDLGNIALVSGNCATNQQINSITSFKDEYNPEYIYYWFSTKKDWLKTIAGNTTTPIINKTDFDNIEIDCPDRVIQDRVVEILSAIDKKIALNGKIIQISERLMREIYDYWFVQFDFPDENGRPYKSSGGEMIYNETLKREIPKGWKVQNLLKNDLGLDIKPGIDKFNNRKTYYATADIVGNDISISTGFSIDFEHRESRANMQPVANSIWFAKMKNSVKHITVLPSSVDLIEESIFSTGFFGIEATEHALPYLRSFIYTDYFEKIKDLNSNGATMEAISNDGIKNIKLLIPDKQALRSFSDKTTALLSSIDVLRQGNKRLTSLRDWLLPMLMNGQIKI